MSGSPRTDTDRAIPVTRLDTRVRNRNGTLLLSRAATVLELGDVAAEIWLAADGERTIDEIAQVVAASYGMEPTEILDDVVELLDSLEAGGIVIFRSTPDGTSQ